MNSEEWRWIPGFENEYSVSNHGRVRSHLRKPRYLSTRSLSTNGYSLIKLRGKTVYIHMVVAEVFLGPRPEGFEINHKDLNKTNNDVSNLEYVTHSENMEHAYRAGRFKNSLPWKKEHRA